MDMYLRTFSTLAFLEGLSYVLLLGIAMPLKYFFDYPLAVTLVGWLHGLLFVLYGSALAICWMKCRWSFRRVLFYFVASLLPVLPFLVERNLRREYPAVFQG